MARPVKDALITASASTEGTTKSIRRGVSSEYSSGRLKKNSSSSGMIRVSPTCSPLRSSSRSSIRVWAASIRAAGAAAGCGRNDSAIPAHRRTG